MKSIQEKYIDGQGWVKEEIEPVVGMIVTVHLYSDSHVYDVIAVSPSTKTLTLRQRKAILVKKPVMVVGGFAGHVVEDAEWRTETDLNGSVTRADWSSSRNSYMVHKRCRVSLDRDSYHYDYNF
jgi:hypothetical protein